MMTSSMTQPIQIRSAVQCRRRHGFRISLLVLALLSLGSDALRAQFAPEGEPAWYGQTGGDRPTDTTRGSELSDRAMQSAGLLERPIDPETYAVGPNDLVSVTIWTGRTQEHTMRVTPDAKLLIPTVGEVNVRGLTLSEAETRVRQAVSRTYKVDASLALRQMREFKVNVIGAVRFRGSVVATPVTRVSEVIDRAGGALERGDVRNIQIIRTGPNEHRTMLDVDLLDFFATGNLQANPTVIDGDVIRVNILDDRKVVRVYGEVVQPGWFSWSPDDSISTLLAASFGPKVNARFDSVEVVSVDDQGNVVSRTYHTWDPARQSVTGDRRLEIGDRIIVRPRPNNVEPAGVVVAGEVMQPGVYAITPGETRLLDIIYEADGFTPKASLLDAVLIRRRAIGAPDPYFDYVWSIESENRSIEESEYLRTSLLERRTQGTMTVDFIDLMNGDDEENLLLVDDDSIYVPAQVDYIRISGKVKSPGNQLFNPAFSYQDYIDAAGGFGWRAEEGETQVIKGRTGDRVPADDRESYQLEPGDAIFVPEEKPSNFWEGVATSLTIVSQALTIIVVVNTLRSNANDGG